MDEETMNSVNYFSAKVTIHFGSLLEMYKNAGLDPVSTFSCILEFCFIFGLIHCNDDKILNKMIDEAKEKAKKMVNADPSVAEFWKNKKEKYDKS